MFETSLKLRQSLAAEFTGSALLVATIIGSGIMAQSLTGGNIGLALLASSIATGAMLFVLITALGPISGAHFNPAVSFVFALRGEISIGTAFSYSLCQSLGGLSGAVIAHLMFGQAAIQLSTHVRSGSAQWIAETVAAFGLIFTILVTLRARPNAVAAAVALYIVSAYWFTASTSFANPAVTLARAFSDSFAGIRLIDVPMFALSQMLGAMVAFTFCNWLLAGRDTP